MKEMDSWNSVHDPIMSSDVSVVFEFDFSFNLLTHLGPLSFLVKTKSIK